MLKMPDVSVLSQDIFQLLGMEALDEVEKEKFMNDFLNSVSKQFFISKILPFLSNEEKDNLSDKYENLDQTTLPTLFGELSEKIPNIADLYVESLREVKAKLVTDTYINKSDMLEDLIAKESDSGKASDLREQYDLCQKNLSYAQNGRFDLITN
ncbi:hypothetical protein IT417_02850 [bacterium]|nr:hypothetical protein [bacterium]